MAITDDKVTDEDLLEVMHVIVQSEVNKHGGLLGIAGRMSFHSRGSYRAAQLFVDNFLVGEGLPFDRQGEQR